MVHIIYQMKLDDTVRNWPVAPFHVSVSWTGNKGKALERLEHDIALISGAKRFKVMISSPVKCTSKYTIMALLLVNNNP